MNSENSKRAQRSPATGESSDPEAGTASLARVPDAEDCKLLEGAAVAIDSVAEELEQWVRQVRASADAWLRELWDHDVLHNHVTRAKLRVNAKELGQALDLFLKAAELRSRFWRRSPFGLQRSRLSAADLRRATRCISRLRTIAVAVRALQTQPGLVEIVRVEAPAEATVAPQVSSRDQQAFPLVFDRNQRLQPAAKSVLAAMSETTWRTLTQIAAKSRKVNSEENYSEDYVRPLVRQLRHPTVGFATKSASNQGFKRTPAGTAELRSS